MVCVVLSCVCRGGGGWGKGAIGASVNNPQLTLPRHAFLRADTCQAKRHQDDSESLGKYLDNCVMCVKACTKSILIDSITQRKDDARKGYNSKTFEQRARENPRLCHGHCQAGEGWWVPKSQPEPCVWGTTCSPLRWRCMPPELDSRFLPVAAVHVQAVAAARCGSGYAAVPWALPGW